MTHKNHAPSPLAPLNALIAANSGKQYQLSMQIKSQHESIPYGVYRIHLAKLQNGKWLYKITDRDYVDLAFGNGYPCRDLAIAAGKEAIRRYSHVSS